MATRSVELHWTGKGLHFRGGGEGGPEIDLDSDGEAGPSPTQALLLSLGACMGIDVVMILEKGRVPLEGLSMVLEGDRAEEPPRRYTAIRLVYRITGPEPEHAQKVDRAVRLSRDKYCSVLHTLAKDIELDIRVELV